jgi:hypothetical protein
MKPGSSKKPDSAGWELVSGPELSATLPEIWARANKALNDEHPALDRHFVSLLHKHFGDGSEVLAISDSCVALLQPCGLGRWASFLPSQACVGSVLLSRHVDSGASGKIFRALSRALPGPTTLLSFRKQDAVIAQLTDLQTSRSFSRSVFGLTTAVDTTQPFDTFWQQRSKNLRQSVRRRFRKLEKDGIGWQLLKISRSEEMAAAVNVHAVLESSGWKGRRGTALDESSKQTSFYKDLMRTLAEENRSRAYQLLFDNEVSASLLTIQAGGVLIVLKTAYHEPAATYAPGRLLDYLMLQDVCGDTDISIIENYTVSSEEDRRWCTSYREIVDRDYYPLNIMQFAIQAQRRIRTWLPGT